MDLHGYKRGKSVVMIRRNGISMPQQTGDIVGTGFAV